MYINLVLQLETKLKWLSMNFITSCTIIDVVDSQLLNFSMANFDLVHLCSDKLI